MKSKISITSIFILCIGTSLLIKTTIGEGQNETVNNLEGNVTFERFMNLSEIEAYLDYVEATYPTIANIQSIGNSYEGRPLKLIKISQDTNATYRPAVFIDAGIHAAEWLGHSTALYIIHQLTTMAEENQEMLELDWYIIPVLNPDGYIHSWTHYRKWRKTRKPNEGSDCIGVDLNRNFDVHFGGGNVTNPCAYNYPGTHAYSESESKAMADFLEANANKFVLYMALHTYGPYLLYPYGYKLDEPPEEIVTAGEEALEAVEAVRGTVYASGKIPKLFPTLAYGSSIDFAFDKLGIPLAYVWELPPGPEEKLIPPPSEILPSAQEVWEGIKVLCRHATSYWRSHRTEGN